MNRRNNVHVRTELAVIPYRYLRIVLNSKVKIEKTVLSYAGMTAVVKGDRSKEKASVANFPDKLGNDSLALLPVALVKLIEITAQIMGFGLFRNKLLIFRIKKYTFFFYLLLS